MGTVEHPPPVADRHLPLDLAVYGTLRRGGRNAAVLGGSAPVAGGRVRGTLHVVTGLDRLPYSYPLLVVPGAHLVTVEVYRVTDPATLADLDRLESYDVQAPQASEYVRARVPLLDGAGGATGAQVQVYAYAGDRGGLGPVLPGGDWFTVDPPERVDMTP